MLTAYCYKLNPASRQASEMGDWLDMLRGLYNFALRERIEAYEQVKAPVMGDFCRLDDQAECCPLTCSVSKSALYGHPWKVDKAGNHKRRSAFEMQCASLPSMKKSRPWYKQVNAQATQQTLRQLDTAFKNFFEHGRGYPAFKRRSRFRSFSYPPGVAKFDGNRVYLPGIGWVRFFNSRMIPEGFSIRTVTVRRKADGWYLSVRLEDKSIPEVPTIHPDQVKTVLGVDVGIRKLAALSTGEMIANPRFGKQTERRKRIRQRRASRKVKGSNNRRKAYQRLARLDQKVEQRRSDYHWKVAHHLNRQAECIVFEDLNIQGMVRRCKPKRDEAGHFIHNGQAAKSGLNKAILDAAWGELKQKSMAVAAKSGNLVWSTHPRHSSQECSVCHFVSPTNRDGEKFLCEACGAIDDADTNASSNLRFRGMVELGIRLDAVLGVPQQQGKITPLELSLVLAGEPGNPQSLIEWRGA
jgi:putative transposase